MSARSALKSCEHGSAQQRVQEINACPTPRPSPSPASPSPRTRPDPSPGPQTPRRCPPPRRSSTPPPPPWLASPTRRWSNKSMVKSRPSAESRARFRPGSRAARRFTSRERLEDARRSPARARGPDGDDRRRVREFQARGAPGVVTAGCAVVRTPSRSPRVQPLCESTPDDRTAPAFTPRGPRRFVPPGDADAFSFAASTAALCIRSPKSPLRRSEAAIAVIRGVNVTDRSSSKVIATGGTAAGFLV